MLAPSKVVSACTAIAAALLTLTACGSRNPAQITSPANNDTVWGKVVIKAALAGSRIPAGGLDFYVDAVKLGNAAKPVANTNTFEYTWDAGALPGASVHSLGAVTKDGKPPRPPQAISVTIYDAPVLTVARTRISGSKRVVRIALQSNCSTVLVESLGFLRGRSGRTAVREPFSVPPNATVLLYEAELRSSRPLPVIVYYRSRSGDRTRDEVAASAVKTETLAIDPAAPTTALHRLLPDTR